MKKLLNLALMSPIVLIGAASFSACSSSDEIVDNPDYNREDNTVKTQLAISLPSYFGPTTRQTAGVAQVNQNFRGMTNVRLIAYEEKVTSGATTPFHDKVYALADFTSFEKQQQNAMVYKDLAIPVGTGAFMFYGKAKDESADYPNGATPQQMVIWNNFHNGVLNGPASYEGAASTYNFSLEQIYTGGEDAKATEILTYLKGIRATVSTVTNHALHGYLTAFQPVAGSSASIQYAVQDLWNKVRAINDDATGVNAVKAAILQQGEKAYATIDETTNVVTLTHANLTGYPENINLPDGAAAINWSDVNNPTINTAAFGSMNVPALSKYVYPAALYYRANTPIGTTTVQNQSENYASKQWSEILSSDLYTWNRKVSGDTHSIALENQIQYAVGRLDLTIKAGAATLYDADGKAVTVHDDGFPVSAILVGDQNNVGYDFTPNGNEGYTIYDKILNQTMAAKNGTAVGINHTLVLETATNKNQVYVAVELTNNSGQDFMGQDGVVPNGGKFYLLGALDLSEATQPAGDTRSKIFEQDYITKADFTITPGEEGAKNPAGLGAAYNVIPDLKTPELEVAFSVSLSWIEGLTFTKNI